MNDSNNLSAIGNCESWREAVYTGQFTFNHKSGHSEAIGVVIVTLYAIVCAIGISGNSLTLFVALRKRSMFNNRNLFIINLALADWVLCTVATPWNLVSNVYLQTWPFGSAACKFVNGMFAFTVFLSTLSISAIGLDRFIAIMTPTQFARARFLTERCLILTLLASVWIISAIMSTPLFYVAGTFTLAEVPSCNLTVYACAELPDNWNRLPFGATQFTCVLIATQYVLPILVMSFVYVKIGSRITARANMRQSQTAPPSHQVTIVRNEANCGNVDVPHRRSIKSRARRTNILLLSIVLVFALSWLPFNINMLVSMYERPSGGRYDPVRFAFTHVVGIASACTNPILYAVLNENFRKEFVHLWQAFRLKVCACLWRNACYTCEHCICTNNSSLAEPSQIDNSSAFALRSARGCTNTITRKAVDELNATTSLLRGKSRVIFD